jgi:hypothetical protein
MVNYISGWFNPTFQSHHQQRNSIIVDMILGVALSTIALISANTFDRNAPGLATLLRCVPIGLTLIGLFKYSVFNRSGLSYTQTQYHAPFSPPYIIPQSSVYESTNFTQNNEPTIYSVPKSDFRSPNQPSSYNQSEPRIYPVAKTDHSFPSLPKYESPHFGGSSSYSSEPLIFKVKQY